MMTLMMMMMIHLRARRVENILGTEALFVIPIFPTKVGQMNDLNDDHNTKVEQMNDHNDDHNNHIDQLTCRDRRQRQGCVSLERFDKTVSQRPYTCTSYSYSQSE